MSTFTCRKLRYQDLPATGPAAQLLFDRLRHLALLPAAVPDSLSAQLALVAHRRRPLAHSPPSPHTSPSPTTLHHPPPPPLRRTASPRHLPLPTTPHISRHRPPSPLDPRLPSCPSPAACYGRPPFRARALRPPQPTLHKTKRQTPPRADPWHNAEPAATTLTVNSRASARARSQNRHLPHTYHRPFHLRPKNRHSHALAPRPGPVTLLLSATEVANECDEDEDS